MDDQLDGVVVLRPAVHHDARGSFVETYRQEWVPGSRPMVQANHAERAEGSLVGLHYHLRQADYWYVIRGHARAVLHDLRVDSPTEGRTQVVDLVAHEEDGPAPVALYIPPGVAHGLAALSDVALTYLVDGYYDPADEHGLAWDDPEVHAQWGLTHPVLSARDRENPRRAELVPDRVPRHPGAG